MSKELFMNAHEQLVEEYMDSHPNATWDEAYKATADRAHDRMRGNLAGCADNLRMQAKERGQIMTADKSSMPEVIWVYKTNQKMGVYGIQKPHTNDATQYLRADLASQALTDKSASHITLETLVEEMGVTLASSQSLLRVAYLEAREANDTEFMERLEATDKEIIEKLSRFNAWWAK